MAGGKILPKATQPAVLPRVPERELAEAGLDLKTLFGWGSKVAFRCVEAVTENSVLVDGAELPKKFVGATVAEGQWLRFSKANDGRVEVSVDLKTTLKAETRLANLMTDLFERG